jgi:membrane protease YdiL (CAAX protease family)
MESRKPLAPFIAYLAIFFAVWTAWVLFVYPRMVKIGDATLLYALLSIGFRLALWVVPVLVYLRYVDRVDAVEYLKLRRLWNRGVIVGLAVSLINFVGTMARFGAPHPNMHNVTWNSILGTSILVGFVEEVPFRGFILQKVEERCGFWLANLISSLLFLAIHLPGWISLHLLSSVIAISVFALGAIFAIVFHYSKSLWSSIVAHSLNDFISFVLFHI